MKKLLLISFAVALAACSSPEKDFKKAQQQDTPAAYQEFLRKNSTGTFADQARARIATLDAEQAWHQAEQLNSADGYEAYVRQYPESAHATEATDRAAGVRRAAAWEKARSESTEASLQAFVAQYPQGPEADQARAQLAQFNAVKAANLKPPAKPAPTQAQKKPAPAVAASSKKSDGNYRVQLGAFQDKAAAERLASKLRKDHAAVLGQVVVVPPAKAKDMFRVRSATMSQEAAQSACAKLQKEHLACVVVGA